MKVSGRPLRVLFLITSLQVGGAETLLVNLMRRFDPRRIRPSLGCLKEPGELGAQIDGEFSVFSHLIGHKFDVGVLGRLKNVMRENAVDTLITVGAGDKMFWGRLAARQAKVPVVLSALHSTGWPDGVGRLNRMLTPITDGFIAVAEPHRQHLIRQERFPEHKVHLIPNGIDTDRFVFDADKRSAWRKRFGIGAGSRVCGIVAALRPEKNHQLFLQVAEAVARRIDDCHFLIVGDGERRKLLEQLAQQLESSQRVHFAGNSHDIPGALSAMDLFSLTSHNEASPVSILEAMSCRLPVVAPQVGSIDRAVLHGTTGFTVPAGDRETFVNHWASLLGNADMARRMGQAAREHVIQYGSLDTMTEGYTCLVENLFARKSGFLAPITEAATRA